MTEDLRPTVIALRQQVAGLEEAIAAIRRLVRTLAARLDYAVCDFCGTRVFPVTVRLDGLRGSAEGLQVYDKLCCGHCFDALYDHAMSRPPFIQQRIRHDLACWDHTFPDGLRGTRWEEDADFAALRRR